MLCVVLCAAILLSSCWPAHKKPQPPPPAPAAVQLPIETKPPQRIDAPPDIIVPEPPKPTTAGPELPPLDPDRMPKVKKNAVRPAQAEAPAVPAGPVGPPADAAAPPQPLLELAPMLTDEQRRAYDTAIDSLIARTLQDISRARSRNLSGEQKEIIDRAQAFIESAKKVRVQDPAAAKSLAERAELLSKDVVGR